MLPAKTIVIHASCHEPKEIIFMLRERHTVIISDLAPGDYACGGAGIERKALGDFFESWKRGRLYDQLSRLAQCYEKRYLIIEAFDLSLFTKPMLVYNILLQCHLNFGVTFLFTRSKEETAGVIGLLARKPVVCNKSSSHSPPPKLRRMLTADERRIMMLCCIQGIGRKKAGKIMKNMKSLCNFFTADNTTLKTKCGIGKRIAAEIRELLD